MYGDDEPISEEERLSMEEKVNGDTKPSDPCSSSRRRPPMLPDELQLEVLVSDLIHWLLRKLTQIT
jgi:hypothetical protein